MASTSRPPQLLGNEEDGQGKAHVGAAGHGGRGASMWRSPFSSEAKYRSSTVLELIHGDLCAKISPPALAGNLYFLLLVDDRSHFMSVVFLSSKDQATDVIERFQVRAECETGEKLGGLHTNRGGEFNSKNFVEYCL
jgi:hypothetical protein